MSIAVQIFEDSTESTLSEADQLGAEITELCSYIYAAESRLLTLIREFDEKQFWAQQGLCSCAHWLNFKCGIGMNAAREKVRVAHALAKLPKVSVRFANAPANYNWRAHRILNVQGLQRCWNLQLTRCGPAPWL